MSTILSTSATVLDKGVYRSPGYAYRMEEIATENGMCRALHLGGGMYSEVYQDPNDPSCVVKFGQYGERVHGMQTYTPGLVPMDGWLYYALAFWDSPSPHKPMVHSIELYDSYYIARMERLVPVLDIDYDDRLLLRENMHDFEHEVRDRMSDLGYGLDLHDANWMLRGTTPVITDPASGWGNPAYRFAIPEQVAA